MELVHIIGAHAREGFETDGFPPTPAHDGVHLLLGHRPVPRQQSGFAYDHATLVVVDLPDDVAARYRSLVDVDADLYEVPWDVLNTYAPFTFVEI